MAQFASGEFHEDSQQVCKRRVMENDQNHPVPFGKYQILEELGRGGFGIVYRAFDTALEVERAIKELYPNLVNDPTFVSSFRQEARFAAKLDHPNIVPVHDFGQINGKYYIAMGYMPGGSLKDLLKREGKLEPERACEILTQVGEGLEYAHARGIVHRDLKPGNILFDENGKARVADMGFAKVMSEGASRSMSASGGLVGTPAYMAPETWRNKPATPQTDIYSLGCILYEMLTGEVLFEGESPAEIMTMHVIDGPVYDEDFPLTTRPVLDRALQRDPAKRYMDAKSLLEAFRSLLEPVLETTPDETEEQEPETTNETAADSIVETQEQVDDLSTESEPLNKTVTGEDLSNIEPPVQIQSESTSQIEDQANPEGGLIPEELKKNDQGSEVKNWDVLTILILGGIIIGVFLYLFSISGTLLNKSSLQVNGTERFRLDARNGWTSTGIDIITGDVVKIQYLGGTWSPWPGDYYTALGVTTSTFTDTANVIMGCKHGALIGRIGQKTPFCIGSNDYSIKATYGGILYLSINDNVLEDDSGSIDLSITINGVPTQ